MTWISELAFWAAKCGWSPPRARRPPTGTWRPGSRSPARWPGRPAGARPERDHRVRHVGMGHQQRREHPGVAVPEDVSVVSAAREAHRRDAHRGAGVGAAEQVEQHRAGHPLELGVAVDGDVGLPALLPGAGIGGRDAVVPERRFPWHPTAGEVERPRGPGRLRRGGEAGELGEGVALAGGGVERDLDQRGIAGCARVALAPGRPCRPAHLRGFPEHDGAALRARREREQGGARCGRRRRAPARPCGRVPRLLVPTTARSGERVEREPRGAAHPASANRTRMRPACRGVSVEPHGCQPGLGARDERLDTHSSYAGLRPPSRRWCGHCRSHVDRLRVALGRRRRWRCRASARRRTAPTPFHAGATRCVARRAARARTGRPPSSSPRLGRAPARPRPT